MDETEQPTVVQQVHVATRASPGAGLTRRRAGSTACNEDAGRRSERAGRGGRHEHLRSSWSAFPSARCLYGSLRARATRWLLQVATYQLQQNLGRVFDVETVEPALRFGFVLGALDAALGLESPEDRRSR